MALVERSLVDTENWDVLPGPSLEYRGRCGCWEGQIHAAKPWRKMCKDLTR